MAEDTIINRVAESGLVSIDLEDFYPEGERVLFDIKDWLFQGLLLKEKDFREHVKTHDWEQYRGKNVAIICSEDAITPTWAYMLLQTKLEPVARMSVFGGLDVLENTLWQQALAAIDLKSLEGAKIVVKGCSKYPVPVFAYTEFTRLVRPLAASIMFGEPCSTVPLYKKPKQVQA